MAKLKFRAARLMMVLVMLGLLVPIHATALPLYVAFDRLSLLNSYTALVAPFSSRSSRSSCSCSSSAPCPTT